MSVKYALIGKGNICPLCRPKTKKKLPLNDIDDEVCEAKGTRQQGWRRRCWCPYQAGTWCQVGWAGGGHYRTQSPNIGHCCLEIRVLWNTGILFLLDQNMNSPTMQYCTFPLSNMLILIWTVNSTAVQTESGLVVPKWRYHPTIIVEHDLSTNLVMSFQKRQCQTSHWNDITQYLTGAPVPILVFVCLSW